MNKIVKSIMIVVMAVVLSLQTVGCGTSPSVPEEVVTASEHLLSVWYNYLDVLDKMYAGELWAIDYVEAYLESGDWNDLTKARTACIASVQYLKELSMTEADLTEDEYKLLADAGIDTGYQTISFQSVAEALDDAHADIRRHLLEGLERDVFDKYLVEILREEVSVQRKYISGICCYTACQTNYLLMTLKDVVDSKTAWEFVQQAYPTLFGEYGEWIEAETELKALGDAYLDEYEEVVLKRAELISMMEADLYRMAQIIQNNDIQAMMEASYPMSNIPDLLPKPVWYNPMQTGYLSFIAAEDGSISYPETGDELGDTEYSMYIQVEDVSEENIIAYLASLGSYAEHLWEAQEDKTWYIKMPAYNVSIHWEENTATILFNGADVTFAPSWYIGLQ